MTRTIVGVDIGGTFTDFVALDLTGSIARHYKVPSTPQDPAQAVLRGISGIEGDESAMLVHSSTVAINTVLQRNGARTAIVTTRGFRDVLELRRRDRPHLYGLRGEHRVLVPRGLRFEIDERVAFDGQVLKPIDVRELEEVSEELRTAEVEAVAIVFLHSYVNAAHEALAADVIRRRLPGVYVTASSELLREAREFERTSTTAVNAYLLPRVGAYVERLAESARSMGYPDLLIVKGNGGVGRPEEIASAPVRTAMSGPAAGVIGATAVARTAGVKHIMTVDIGGTSTDVSVVPDLEPHYRRDQQLEFGLPVNVPTVDVLSIGAGGGSLAWIDAGGFLQIGPESAGSSPGPASYGLGGSNPTVTDANLVLGRISERSPMLEASGLTLNPGLARDAIDATIARELGLSTEDAALAIVGVANTKICNALRLVSVERGHDPKRFALVAYGGGGPLHAGELMRQLGVSVGLIPLLPGVLSALGCVIADFKHEFVQTFNRPLDDLSQAELHSAIEKHAALALQTQTRDGVDDKMLDIYNELEASYLGQAHSLAIRVDSNDSLDDMKTRFAQAFTARYGAALGLPMFVFALRTLSVGRRNVTLTPLEEQGRPDNLATDSAIRDHRSVYFGSVPADVPVYERGRLQPSDEINGPAVIEQVDTTVLVDPALRAVVDPYGNLLLTQLGA